MLRMLRKKSGQAVSAEYLLLTFIIVGFITAMSIYFRRVVQGRIRDAKMSMKDIVDSRAGGRFIGEIPVGVEYEPYYVDVETGLKRGSKTERGVAPSFDRTSGIGVKRLDEGTMVQSNSIVAPPREAADDPF